MQRGDRDSTFIAIKRRLDRRQRIVSAEEVLRHPDWDVGCWHVGLGANYRRCFAGGWTGRAACSCTLERIAQLHPPYRALFLVAAEQNALNRDDVVGQAFVGNPVSNLLVAHPNVAGESGLFPRLALLVRSWRPGPASQMPIKQIAEAQSAWRLKHIRGRHDRSISGDFNRAADRFRYFGVFFEPVQPGGAKPPTAEPYYEETANDHTTSRPSVGRRARSQQLSW